MRLVLDMVVNHSGIGARIDTQHPDWFHDATNCHSAIECPYRAGIHDFAQEKPEVADYLSRLSAGWVSRLGLDGIRMDTALYVAPSYFQNSWVPAVRQAHGGLFLVAEVFSEQPRDLSPYLNAGFDAAFGFPMRKALLDVFAHGAPLDELADAVATERSLYGDKTIVHMLDNHDVPRFVNEPGFGVPEDEIRRRYHLALAAIFTLAGRAAALYGRRAGDVRRRRSRQPARFSVVGFRRHRARGHAQRLRAAQLAAHVRLRAEAGGAAADAAQRRLPRAVAAQRRRRRVRVFPRLHDRPHQRRRLDQRPLGNSGEPARRHHARRAAPSGRAGDADGERRQDFR